MPPPTDEIRTWTRQLPDKTTYTISTDPSLIQLDAINAAFATDMVYWAGPLPLPILKRCIEQSLCFGLYVHGEEDQSKDQNTQAVQNTSSSPATSSRTGRPAMVGLARLVTDYTTFAYLTDVYVLPHHQGRGLGRWLMACLDEVLVSWPALRRCLLLTRDEAAVRMYGTAIGARELVSASSSSSTTQEDDDGAGEKKGKGGGGLFILERRGPGIGFTA
ncbi:hypothetical protein P885DRAFT_76597 [Corynascus similis CBS 632.67]